ncbi:MAG: hypothetical protein AAGG51_20025 [Cyanobacteria bacterium P01_G01_bin.54]
MQRLGQSCRHSLHQLTGRLQRATRDSRENIRLLKLGIRCGQCCDLHLAAWRKLLAHLNPLQTLNRGENDKAIAHHLHHLQNLNLSDRSPIPAHSVQ